MNAILSIPWEYRLAVLFVLGTLLGSLANAGVYRLAWHPRRIGPWSPRDPKAPPRRWTDWLPIFGWLGLRREAPLHGTGYWVRPMLLELACGFGLMWLYYWETEALGLVPGALAQVVHAGRAPAAWMTMFHIQFAVHAFLIWLMLIASLIDIDEKTIPDTITVGGTLVGLTVVTLWPGVLLPMMHVSINVPFKLEPWPVMMLTAPYPMPNWLAGFPNAGSLAIGLACWWLWCFALMRRDWHPRHGLRRAWQVFCARLARDPSTWRITLLGLLGTALITTVWSWADARHWNALLTSLVGMAAAGGVVWIIRILGARAMGREAMGFGDVTLMAMIGVYLGWQASVMAFFLAPLAALVVGLLLLLFRGETEIYYGPFICLSTLVFVLRWDAIWQSTEPWFSMGLLVPLVLVFCLALLPILLWVTQQIKGLFRQA
ncbi:MAG: prepilin peptidase [Pirellulales bacterium]|nr:prepilin peptidase [Pirellulales bacterium]